MKKEHPTITKASSLQILNFINHLKQSDIDLAYYNKLVKAGGYNKEPYFKETLAKLDYQGAKMVISFEVPAPEPPKIYISVQKEASEAEIVVQLKCLSITYGFLPSMDFVFRSLKERLGDFDCSGNEINKQQVLGLPSEW